MDTKNFILNIIEKDIIKNNLTKINTRFAPDPNGYLHIGHVKSILINYLIAKKYNGNFNIRIDDTNPINRNDIYINEIINNIKWLGIKYNGIEKYTSNYFNEIFKFAIILIKKKLAYVDELPISIYKKYKGNYNNLGIDSPYRNRSVKENIDYFLKMKNGFYKENHACLRAKINMKSSNIIIRDPILYRIKYKKHFKTKYNWCIYPTYDFSHCICDFLEEITYSLCTLEFQNNKILYNWILDSLDIKNKPKQYEFSRLNIEYLTLSKRKLNILVEKNIVTGWDDPRMPTISGLKNRGYTSKSIIDFCNSLGITKKNSLVKIKNLEFFIKNDLNFKSIRIMSVINPIKLYIINLKKNFFIKTPLNPNNLKNGYKLINFCNELYVEKNDFINKENFNNLIGKIFKLRYSYILKIIDIEIKKDIINKIYCIYYKNTINNLYLKNNKVNKIIHWVSCKYNFISYYIFYDYIFKNINYLKNKNILDYINNNSIIIKKGFTEKSNYIYSKNIYYQFERIGYFNIKNINNNKIIFNNIINF
ncbi:glutamine--tRNA ligase [endosymbiont of Euscepes postfasciatus]|uniref:glutamine--tRNA ligase n=1 Tax=endosymbiont of Euscepes postfasciatus TaxID=650377 RepID=UPI000DC72215|nr:glutamine--tRNA ligase [endosymbiont of Euscepes postfasciatus]BBA84723.1 glutamine--tRNA ligase [endosymbiont of Euscepes postfasciatus]